MEEKFDRRTGLVIVDMQRYYLEEDSPFGRFHENEEPGCLDYIHRRCRNTVLPNIQKLLAAFRTAGRPVFFLRLCGSLPDRSDLHPNFAEIHRLADAEGTPGVYPLVDDPMSEISPHIAPLPEDAVYTKTTYSAFTGGPFEADLRAAGVTTLVFAGLATSQCVDTTARDAADRGYRVIHVEDAQADYSEAVHFASLRASRGVCGGYIATTQTLLEALR